MHTNTFYLDTKQNGFTRFGRTLTPVMPLVYTRHVYSGRNRDCHFSIQSALYKYEINTTQQNTQQQQLIDSQTSGTLFFSRPQSESWPHHGRTFSIYPCPLSFWSTLPRWVLSTSWCCPSRPCVAFLAFVHLAGAYDENPNKTQNDKYRTEKSDRVENTEASDKSIGLIRHRRQFAIKTETILHLLGQSKNLTTFF